MWLNLNFSLWCFMDYCLSFLLKCFGHCIVCLFHLQLLITGNSSVSSTSVLVKVTRAQNQSYSARLQVIDRGSPHAGGVFRLQYRKLDHGP